MNKLILHLPDGSVRTITAQFTPLALQMTITGGQAIAEIRDSQGNYVAVVNMATVWWIESDLQTAPNA